MKFQNGLVFRKITFWYFRSIKTTTVPVIIFHTFIENDASLIEKKYNLCLTRKQYLIYIKQKIIQQSM